MPPAKEQLDLYFPTYLHEAEKLRGVVIDACATYLPPVVGGNVEQQMLQHLDVGQLQFAPGKKSLMVPALRTLKEGVAKTTILRVDGELEGGLLATRSKLESNISKTRGKKRQPIWGKEGAVDFLANEMPIRELEFAGAALQRSIGSRPSERKKLVLVLSKESAIVIRGIQQTLLKGIRPALRRGVAVNEQIFKSPVCPVADIDTSQSDDVHIRHFLDAVTTCFPVTLPASRQLSIKFSSYGDSG